MDKEIENMTKEEELALLRAISTNIHTVFSDLFKTMGNDGQQDVSYFMTVQEYDEENGTNP